MAEHDCSSSSIKVGESDKHGDVFRCNQCGFYWCIQSDRLWEDPALGRDGHEAIAGYSPVFYGSGELGLANALANGLKVNRDAILNQVSGSCGDSVVMALGGEVVFTYRSQHKRDE